MPITLGLDERQITIATGGHGAKIKKPALDSYWMEQVDFLTYQPPPPEDSDAASQEEWMERVGFIEEDLCWLLKLPHHRFWSQVVYDMSLQQCLDSYLRSAPRPFDPVAPLPDDLSSKQQTIHKLVFMTFLRMATHKESKDGFINQFVFGEILYEYFLFDVAKLMELCVLYGGGNAELLRKMISNIFNSQPKYNEDLIEVVPTILKIFDDILTKCGLKVGTYVLQAAPTSRVLHSIPDNELGEIIHYLTDSALSLLSFLEIYPEGAFAFHKHGFVLKAATFFETFMPAVELALKERHWGDTSKRKSFQKHLALGKVGLARVCRCVVTRCHIQPIVECSSREEVSKLVEDYLELMSSLLSDKHFLAVFARQYSIGEDLDVVLQKSHVDETRAQFILDGFRGASSVRQRSKPQQDGAPAVGATEAQRPSGIDAAEYRAAPEDYQTDQYIEEFATSSGACGGGVSEVEMASLISSVKDIFPEYGEGFIEACLEEYTFDSSKVINAILEQKLVPGLCELDKAMQRTPKPPATEHPTPATSASGSSLLQQRSNIYQNDEFDVFSRDTIDTSRVYKGKKGDKVSNQKLLDDKTQLNALRSTYEEYNYEYEDEYDDTYDANDVGADDADSADELTSRRPFMVPRVLRGADGNSSSGDEDGQDSDPPASQNLPNNPQHRQQSGRGGGRGGDGGGGGGGGGGGARQAAVKGQSRGRGQTKDTQKAREVKSKHKGSRANHNRKAMADKKRNKGMGPLS